MTTLNFRQRTKISAALALIQDHGYSAKSVADAVRADIQRGRDPRWAYELAFKEIAKGKPALAGALDQTLRLIEASDPLTVSLYSDALDRYHQTGNAAALSSIAQTFKQDSIALAVKNGELSREDARDPAAIEAAFGFPFGPGAASSGATAPPPPATNGPQSGFAEPTGATASAGAAWRAGGFQPITGPENGKQGTGTMIPAERP